MKLTIKKHPNLNYSSSTALRYGWWRSSGEIFKNLKHEYNFDDFLSEGIALQVYELEASGNANANASMYTNIEGSYVYMRAKVEDFSQGVVNFVKLSY
jgi:hypothetical protein